MIIQHLFSTFFVVSTVSLFYIEYNDGQFLNHGMVMSFTIILGCPVVIKTCDAPSGSSVTFTCQKGDTYSYKYRLTYSQMILLSASPSRFSLVLSLDEFMNFIALRQRDDNRRPFTRYARNGQRPSMLLNKLSCNCKS